MFNALMTETLTLRKSDGRVFEKIRARVAERILIEDVKLPIQVGDKLTRLLPNGLTEEFIVEDPGFHARFSSVDAHFQVKFNRANVEKKASLVHNVFHGPVGNIAQNSQHFSQTASVEIQSDDIARLVADLSSHLDDLKLDPRQQQRVQVQIETLKAELAGEPDQEIVKQSLRTIRNITEGAIGSLLAAAVTQPTVWQWVEHMLSKF